MSFYDPERDGVTFSTLSTFKECREKSRLSLQGWTRQDSGMGQVFGTVVHALLQNIYGDVQAKRLTQPPPPTYVKKQLALIEQVWRTDNPRADAQTLEYLESTMMLAEATMPNYFRYWSKDFSDRTWLNLEHEFHLPFSVTLPVIGKIDTFLRGKLDGVYTMGGKAHPWLLETKTKSRIEEGALADIMPFELQVNEYLYALRRLHKIQPAGVLYNIIRRPGLRQKQSESYVAFTHRVIEDVQMRPDWYFIRMEMVVDQQDLDRFEGELEDLISDFLMWWYGHAGHYKNSGACETKYGICPMIGMCARRDSSKLFKRDKVFRELEEV